MISFFEAQRLVLGKTGPLKPITLPIIQTLGMVLAEDCYALSDIPIFDNSAMDGFALRSIDTVDRSKSFKIIGTLKAGAKPNLQVGEYETVRVMTGAPIPKGADGVIIQEEVDEVGDQIYIKKQVASGDNIRFQGEELKKGALTLKSGTLLTPPCIGLLASIGLSKILVYPRPKVSLLVTGSEVVDIGKRLEPSQIWDANGPSLIAGLREINIIPRFLGISSDNPKIIEAKIKKGLSFSNVLIITGGVSVGEFDLVKDILKRLNVEMVFWQVAQKPGKPLYFARKGTKLIFGLPGNPAAVLVCFYEYIRPALLKMMGWRNQLLSEIEAFLTDGIRVKPGRTHILRGMVSVKDGNNFVSIAENQGSHILFSFAYSNGLVIVPEREEHLPKGFPVTVHLLPWYRE